MWYLYMVFGCYFLLALLIPVFWALGNTWRYAHVGRRLTCPATGAPAEVGLDPWFAVCQHVSGANEFRVLQCSDWPERRDCAQECLAQIQPR